MHTNSRLPLGAPPLPSRGGTVWPGRVCSVSLCRFRRSPFDRRARAAHMGDAIRSRQEGSRHVTPSVEARSAGLGGAGIFVPLFSPARRAKPFEYAVSVFVHAADAAPAMARTDQRIIGLCR